MSSDYAQPITGQVTEVTHPVIDRAQPELAPSKRQKKAQICCSVSHQCTSWPICIDCPWQLMFVQWNTDINILYGGWHQIRARDSKFCVMNFFAKLPRDILNCIDNYLTNDTGMNRVYSMIEFHHILPQKVKASDNNVFFLNIVIYLNHLISIRVR